MPVGIETEYDQTQPWSSQYTPNKAWRSTPDQINKIQQAMAAASPYTPADALRMEAPVNVVAIPPTLGQPTIDDVLGQAAGQAPQMSIFDYSGSASGGGMASPAPNISV